LFTGTQKNIVCFVEKLVKKFKTFLDDVIKFSKNIDQYFLGFIALVVGGNDNTTELYSPTGNCNRKLAAFPLTSNNPVLVYVNEMVIACSGGKSCWEYKIKENSWSVIATAPFAHNYQPGVVYQEKVYVMDESNPQVFDPSSKAWSSWPTPPKKTGNAPWMVGWMDCIILLGGSSNLRGIQIFNITKQTWAVMDSSQVPMDMHWSSSLTLPNGNVLIAGSYQGGYHNSTAFYNPTNNSWTELVKTATSHQGTRLVQLGTQIFAIGGRANDLVEEFILETNAWKPVNTKLLVRRDGYLSLLALPAKLFSHLQGGCQGVD
jgi:hypothetical protein